MITFFKRYDRTTEFYLLPLDQQQVEAIVANYVSGQSSVIECVHGMAKCHPKDKLVKAVGKEEAQKRAKKRKLRITGVAVNNDKVTVNTQELSVIMFKDSGRVIIK